MGKYMELLEMPKNDRASIASVCTHSLFTFIPFFSLIHGRKNEKSLNQVLPAKNYPNHHLM